MNLLEIIGQGGEAAKDLNLGAAAGAGTLDLLFGKAEQLDASKYQIQSKQSEENNKTLLIGLSFIAIILVLALGGIYFASK